VQTERKTVKLRDVAELAGVSEATASRVLGNSRPVGEQYRDRVLAAAAKLDYEPNPHARALAQARDASVGVVVHDVSDPYFSEIVRGALGAAEAGGRMVLICNTYRDPGREIAYIRHFRAQQVDALLLAGSGQLDRTVSAQIAAEILGFERAGGRVALIGRHQAAGDCVLPDNIDGGRQMADHLVQLGHDKIGVISGPEGLTTNFDRLVGFRSRLAELGAKLPEDHIVVGDFTRTGGESAAASLLQNAPDLSAIFALNDVMAIGVMSWLRRQGARVPRDVSVAGFDDIPVAEDMQPALTTVRVPMEEMGRRAFMVAVGAQTKGFHVEHLSTELVVRESTAPPGVRGRRRVAGSSGSVGHN
jgi:LacI family transcriptional regulator